ncbi:MAG: glycosyltransferase [Bauldia sp.]|nr:glycosyltransferase [Bauldia sp.]
MNGLFHDGNGERPSPARAGAGDIEVLERRLVEDPNGPYAEAALERIASLLSTQIKTGKTTARASGAPSVAAAYDRPREPLAAKEWIAQVPGELKDDLFASLIGAQEALIAELAEGEAIAPAEADIGRVVEAAAAAYERRGLLGAIHVLLRDATREARSTACESLAERLAPIDRRAAIRLYWLAYGSSPSGIKARKVAQRMFKLGDLSSSGRLAESADFEAMTPFMGELRLATALQKSMPAIRRKPGSFSRTGTGIAYVASSALPYKVVGYTVRTHSLLSALREEGIGVKCYVRPGYPWDRPAVLGAEPAPADVRRVGEVDYLYTRIPDITQEPERFIERMADALVTRFRDSGVRLVHAASNHRTALPALIAARQLSLPFVYEVRGLWELTTATRIPWWEETERFALDRSLELLIARNADHVLAITQGVADELIAGGVEPENVSLLPNGVDPSRFAPAEPDAQLRARFDIGREDFVLVYCGSLTAYEGLDDLVAAADSLNPAIRARLLVVGEGPYLEPLRTAAAARRFGSAVTFLGAVPPGDIPRYWALADAVALPRKPFKVCEVVSPLKPFEAMAMGKPLILSDLPVSREIVRDGETGLLCRPADPQDLAATIARLARDPALRQRLGAQGRAWAVSHHSWQMNARRLVEVYDRLAPIGVVDRAGFEPAERALHKPARSNELVGQARNG